MERLLLIFLAAITTAQQGNLPAPPPLAPVPPPDAVEARQRAAEQSAALEKAARTGRDVTRTFAVGWEIHHGVYLVPAQAKDWLTADLVLPDFLTGELRDRLAAAASVGEGTGAHAGQRLLCRCTGVSWSFYGEKRFLIRQVDLVWR